MGVTGVVGMLLGAGEALTFGQLRTLPFAVVNNYGFAVLPMFVLMGVLAERRDSPRRSSMPPICGCAGSAAGSIRR